MAPGQFLRQAAPVRCTVDINLDARYKGVAPVVSTPPVFKPR